MNKSIEVCEALIEQLEIELAKLRQQYDDAVSPQKNIAIAMTISEYSDQLSRLKRFLILIKK